MIYSDGPCSSDHRVDVLCRYGRYFAARYPCWGDWMQQAAVLPDRDRQLVAGGSGRLKIQL
jgi:hypothetical protein